MFELTLYDLIITSYIGYPYLQQKQQQWTPSGYQNFENIMENVIVALIPLSHTEYI